MIADVSFEHDSMTANVLQAKGIAGVIGYASKHLEKCMTKANLADWQDAGLAVGMVYEDDTNDMTLGALTGILHGSIAMSWAQAIGYYATNCVIFAANDRNSMVADFPAILAYMESFAKVVPNPGYYGDQDSIDYLWGIHPNWFYWQSDSTSFGNGVSAHADLVQRYNDPRVSGLPLDANDLLTNRIPWMGDDMYTQADRDRDNKVAQLVGVINAAEQNIGPAIGEIRGNARAVVAGMTALQSSNDPANLAAALAPLLHKLDPTELHDALTKVLREVQLTVAP